MNMQVGACIVNKENKIVGIGHNDLPESRESSNESFPYWKSTDVGEHSFERTKYAYGMYSIPRHYPSCFIMINYCCVHKSYIIIIIIIIMGPEDA